MSWSNITKVGLETEPSAMEPVTHSNINPESEIKAQFYTTEREQIFCALKTLRPSVL